MGGSSTGISTQKVSNKDFLLGDMNDEILYYFDSGMNTNYLHEQKSKLKSKMS